jgi:hypothetical protein
MIVCLDLKETVTTISLFVGYKHTDRGDFSIILHSNMKIRAGIACFGLLICARDVLASTSPQNFQPASVTITPQPSQMVKQHLVSIDAWTEKIDLRLKGRMVTADLNGETSIITDPSTGLENVPLYPLTRDRHELPIRAVHYRSFPLRLLRYGGDPIAEIVHSAAYIDCHGEIHLSFHIQGYEKLIVPEKRQYGYVHEDQLAMIHGVGRFDKYITLWCANFETSEVFAGAYDDISKTWHGFERVYPNSESKLSPILAFSVSQLQGSASFANREGIVLQVYNVNSNGKVVMVKTSKYDDINLNVKYLELSSHTTASIISQDALGSRKLGIVSFTCDEKKPMR